MLTKEAILKEGLPKTETFKTASGEILLRGMTGTEWETFENEFYSVENGEAKPKDGKSFRNELLARTIVDESGLPMFDASELEPMSARFLAKLFTVARRLNGVGKDVDDQLEKN